MSDEAQTDLFGDEIDATVAEVLENIDTFEQEDMKLIYSRRLVEFYEIISYILTKQAGTTGDENHKLTAVIVAAIGDYFGGVSFYLPHNEKMKKFMRDVRIYKASFKTPNVADLARKFGVTQQTVYNAIAKQRDLRQRKLPF